MPIKIPSSLPAAQILESENILDPDMYTINGNIIVQNKGMKLVREME